MDPSFVVDDAADNASAVAHRQAAELLTTVDHHGAQFWKSIAMTVDRSISEDELTRRG